jgi:formylglycine-generating enzyme required for sulfatase activity/AAA+ ATPase superfamily predicted ATPase
MSEEFKTIPNPYIVGNPIKNANMFYGRQDEFEFAKSKIKSGDKSYVIVYCGERRSGKTSILFQILSGQLGDTFLPVLIDMQTMAGLHNDSDFLAEISQEICRTLDHRSIDIHDYDFGVLTASPYKTFEALLDKILTVFPGKHLILLIDEYEMMEEKFEDGSLSRDVVSFFSGLLESERRLSFIFTGSRHLEQRTNVEYWRVLFGKSLYRRISFLSNADAERLITEPVKGTVQFDSKSLEAIYRLTAGQPFYTQVVCQNLIDHLNEHQKYCVDEADIEVVTEGILQNPLPQMIYIWNSLNDLEKLAVAVLAELQPKTDQFVPVSKIVKFIKQKDRGFPIVAAELQRALANLYERELVSRKSDNHRIRIELIGKWVRREFSFWKIIHDLRPQSGDITDSVLTRRSPIVKFGFVVAPIAIIGLAIWLFMQPSQNANDASATAELVPAQQEAQPLDTQVERREAELSREKMQTSKKLLAGLSTLDVRSESYQSAAEREKAADSAFASGNYSGASALFEAASGFYDLAAQQAPTVRDPVQNAPLQPEVDTEAQTLADDARDTLVRSKTAAQLAKADKYAQADFQSGLTFVTFEATGNIERDGGDFVKAKSYYEAATKHFDRAGAASAEMAEAISEARNRIRQIETNIHLPQAVQVYKLGERAESQGDISQALDYYETAHKLYADRLQFIDNMNFVPIRGGTFTMGHDGGRPDEQPAHNVSVGDFHISKFEVTNAQYAAFLNSESVGAQQVDAWIDLSQSDSHIEQTGNTFRAAPGFGEHPVVYVTWDGAEAFCKWAGGRLPSEAQWEYACRGGSATAYYFGEDKRQLSSHSWFGQPTSQAVGQKQPNAFGLHDMLGNVWEWCSDWYDPKYYAKGDAESPMGPMQGTSRVLRGGAFNSNDEQCRVSTRSPLAPFDRYNSVGFRMVRDAK